MRCLKKISDCQKSGADSTKMPTCKLFHLLLFLKDFVSNRETSGDVVIANASMSNDATSDESNQITPPLTPPTPDDMSISIGGSKKQIQMFRRR